MYNQFTELKAKIDFSLKLEGKGRPCVVKAGDLFLITNPRHMQVNGFKVARKRTARINEGYLLSAEHINQLFEVVQ